MVPCPTDPGNFALDLIREALGAVATVNARDRIIRQALYSAGEEHLPDDPAKLQEFVREHLHMAVEFALGPDTADAIIDDLAPLVAQLRLVNVSAPHPRPQQASEPFDGFDFPLTASETFELPRATADAFDIPLDAPEDFDAAETFAPPTAIESFDFPHVTTTEEDEVSQVRPSASLRPIETTSLQEVPVATHIPSKRPTVPAPALCLVLLATRDEARAHAFANAPSIGTIPLHVEDALSLMDNLVSAAMQPSIVVIDCLRPSVQPATLAAMAPDLASSCSVVLWGATEQTERELQGFSEETASWVRCPPSAAPSEIATACTNLFAAQLRRLLR